VMSDPSSSTGLLVRLHHVVLWEISSQIRFPQNRSTPFGSCPLARARANHPSRVAPGSLIGTVGEERLPARVENLGSFGDELEADASSSLLMLLAPGTYQGQFLPGALATC
jgi:hypothetical protein